MTIFQGEIWEVDLNPTIGDEMSKKRVCLVVNSDVIGILKLRTVVPITRWQDKFEQVMWMTKIEANGKNGLIKSSTADAFQVRSLSINRFSKRVGVIENELLFQVHEAIAKTLNPIYKILNNN
jgi:mRNA interferase MazF